jgi:hypothetical protein
VVAIYWTGPQAESRRRPDGSSEWVRISEGEWSIGFDARARFELEGRSIQTIGNVEFVVDNSNPTTPSIEGRILDFIDGKFQVS